METVRAGDYWSRAPRARTALALLLCINLFNYIDRSLLAAAQPRIRESLFVAGDPHSPHARELMGLLASGFLVCYLVAAPIAGFLAERRSRWLLIAVAVLLWSLASGASGLATSFAALLVARCLVGIGEGAYGPVAPAILSDLYPVAARGRMLGWFYMAIPVGSALGYVLGGQLAAGAPQRESWRWAFYAVVVPGVLLGLAAAAMRDPPRGAADAIAGDVRAVRWKDYGVLVRTRSYLLNMGGMTAMLFAAGTIGWWMPEYLESHGATACWGIQPTPFFGLLTAVAGLFGTWAGAAAADFLKRWHRGSYFLVSGVGLLIGAAGWLLFLGASFPLAWGFLLITEFCLFFNTGPAFTIVANVTHPALRPTAYAWHILVIHLLGDALSPPLAGALADRYEGDLLPGFVAAAAFLLLGGLLWIWGARYLHRDMLAAPASLDEKPSRDSPSGQSGSPTGQSNP